MSRSSDEFEYNKNLWEKYLSDGKFSAAIEIMCKTSDIYYEKVEPLYELTWICKKLLKSDPTNMDVYYFLAICYIKLYDFGLAEVVVRKALKLNPESVRFYDLLAYLYIRLLDIPQAIDIYKKLMKLVPEDEKNFLFKTGFAYFCRGKLEKAMEIWKDIIEKYPQDKTIMYALELTGKYTGGVK
ncbi:MAG TPA: tetratricopeptide repeat protein [Candidatus Eremiobacteraeota bacterium]|nr:MAG: Tetratricopeptide repeat protein [bacterium ADurb.Bin363]HPZ10284.1 tetratricopeptide repeat protein [Candidatus Eremiobacteraeota bacterium]